jgi:acetyl esterase/lipase
MAPGRGRRGPHLLILALLVLAACAEPTASLATSAAEKTTTVVEMTTTTTPATTSSTVPTRSTIHVEPTDLVAEVILPPGPGPHPAVVMVHGGAWVGGSPSTIRGLATHIADEGFLVVNARYRLSNSSPGFPGAVDDIACAVRYAAAHPRSDGTVTVIGHSAGAHIGALVALTGNHYGEDCPVSGSGVPDRFIGLAGPYDITRLRFLMVPFFGAGPDQAGGSWLAGNPQNLADENPGLVSLIMHGELDGIVDPSYSADFHRALDAAGGVSELEIVPAARHLDLADPSVVGDLIVVWLER